jgi:hypothetical protein
MTKEKVTRLSNDIFKQISRDYGHSKYHQTLPYLSIEDSPYSDADDPDCFGEYDRDENELVVYWKNIHSREDLIRTIIHEYQHYLQSPIWYSRYWTMGYGYVDHPYEVSARKVEEMWETYT